MLTRRLKTVLFVAAAILLVAGSIAVIRPWHHEDLGASFQADGPVVGREVGTLTEARGLVVYPLPLLPTVELNDPCLSARATSRLSRVYVGDAKQRADRDVGLTYEGGIWIRVSPSSQWSPAIDPASNELKAVENAFNPTDYPAGLITGTTRGHVAWLNERDSDHPCGESHSYNRRQMAVLAWLENDTMIEMSGPYPVSTLQDLSAKLRFE